jgi:hypothetical protein
MDPHGDGRVAGHGVLGSHHGVRQLKGRERRRPDGRDGVGVEWRQFERAEDRT